MSDDRTEQNEGSHPKWRDFFRVVDLVEDQVVTASDVLAVVIINPADRKARERQKPDQRAIGIAEAGRVIEKDEKNRGCNSREDAAD